MEVTIERAASRRGTSLMALTPRIGVAKLPKSNNTRAESLSSIQDS